MIKNIYFLLLLLIFPSLAFADGVTYTGMKVKSNKKKAILCIGDSITAGVGWDNDGNVANDWGYRKKLQDLLGIGVYEMVGSVNRPTSDATYGVANWGVSGQIAQWFISSGGNTDGIRFEIQRSMSNLSDDSVVLLHVGTNDIILQYLDNVNKRSNVAIIADINTLIDRIYDANKKIKILVALIVPDRRAGQETFWGVFHDDLKAALITKQATVPTVVIVDMYEAFVNDRYGVCSGDWFNNCMNPFSGDHPSFTGYEGVMARQWADCIQSKTNPGCNGN